MTDAGQPSPQLDNLGTALAAISIGAASGGAAVSLVLALAHGMTRGAGQPFAWIVLGGAVASVVVAAGVAFAIGRRLGIWRAFMMSSTAVAGSLLVTVLTLPADLVAGRTGLFALAGLCVVVILGARRVFFGATEPA